MTNAASAAKSTATPDRGVSWTGRPAPLLVAIAFYAVLAFLAGRGDGFHYLQLMRPGAYFAHPGVLVTGQRAEPNYGYDGQFYFYLAEDPFLRNPATVASLDGSFRYRRLLYPVLAWLLSGGQRPLLPLVLFAINVLAALACVVLVARAAVAARASPWVALLVAVYPGIWVPVLLDTTETLQTALSATALVTGLAGFGLLAALTKETGGFALFAMALRRWFEGRRRGALLAAGLLAAYVLWALAVRYLILPGLTGWGGPLDLFYDLANRHGDVIYMATHGSLASRLLPSATALVFVIAIARLAITRDEATLAAAPYAAVVLSLGVDTWVEALEYLRYAGFLLVLLLVSWVRLRDRLGSLGLVLAAAVSLLSLVALAQLLA